MHQAFAAAWSDMREPAWYSVRAIASLVLALGLSFSFQLSSPMSSVTTALIVANPLAGALVSKSVWRLAGTVIGAAATVVMMAFFAQSPVLFMLVMSVLIGVACCVSTLLRFFKAYAAVLAGYTIVIVSIPVFSHPENVFISALSRLSAVTVGLASTAFVFLITSIGKPSHVLVQIEQTLRMVAALFGKSADFFGELPPTEQAGPRNAGFRDGAPTSYYTERGRILGAAEALAASVEFAAADSFEVSRRAKGLSLGIARLLAMVGSHHPVWQALHTQDPAATEARRITRAMMKDIGESASELANASHGATMRNRIDHALGGFDGLIEQTDDLYAVAIIDSERQLLEQMRAALANLTEQRGSGIKLKLFLEWPAALRNGARGAFVTFLACMIWYVFSWNSGPVLLSYLVPAACLLSTAPSATRAAVMFASGTLLALPMALVMQIWILPQIDGFPLLAFWLSVCLLPGLWIQFHPRYALRGFGYAVFLNVMIEVHNPSHYDDISLMNSWLALGIASIALAVVFRVVLPADQRLDGARLIRSVVRAIEKLAAGFDRRNHHPLVWEFLQVQKVQRMIQRLSFVTPPARVTEVADAAFVALSVGRAILRLKGLTQHVALTGGARDEVAAVLTAIRSLRRDPVSVAEKAHSAATSILAISQQCEVPRRVHLLRVAASLLQISFLVESMPGFFDRCGPMQRGQGVPGFDAPLNWPVGSGVRGVVS